MKVLFAASEALPFASTGGLADVIGSLPSALLKKDIDARVVIPLYNSIRKDFRADMEFLGSINVNLAWREQYCGIYTQKYNGVQFYFIDNEYYFFRESMYGNFDDGERYAFFSRAILDIMPFIDFVPDILHTNDWQTALSVVYLRRKYNLIDIYKKIKSVHTIHNINYQGSYDMKSLYDIFDLQKEDAQIVEYNGMINLTKGAIECCDQLTTVSKCYADELCYEPCAAGLSNIINLRRGKFTGIINGIDIDYYNPESDNDIYKQFNSTNIENKSINKKTLQAYLGLPQTDSPMISMITRLTNLKGLDLVRCVIEELLYSDIQFVMLGTGEEDYENYFSWLMSKYPLKVSTILRFDKKLSKQIYAGSDIFLMPSMTEPCGLAQMIASRYGTVPIVRETGGLYDTIRYYDNKSGEGNGFTFKNFNAHDMLYTIYQAIDLYKYSNEKWIELSKKIMNIDFSWDVPAKEYIELYNNL